MRAYCTYFDSNYLPQGLAMRSSLERALGHAPNLWVCCMDDETFDVLSTLNLDGLNPFRLADLEKHFPKLLEVKNDRSRIEYYFTCTPAVVRYTMDKNRDSQFVIYFCFFNNYST